MTETTLRAGTMALLHQTNRVRLPDFGGALSRLRSTTLRFASVIDGPPSQREAQTHYDATHSMVTAMGMGLVSSDTLLRTAPRARRTP